MRKIVYKGPDGGLVVLSIERRRGQERKRGHRDLLQHLSACSGGREQQSRSLPVGGKDRYRVGEE